MGSDLVKVMIEGGVFGINGRIGEGSDGVKEMIGCDGINERIEREVLKTEEVCLLLDVRLLAQKDRVGRGWRVLLRGSIEFCQFLI